MNKQATSFPSGFSTTRLLGPFLDGRGKLLLFIFKMEVSIVKQIIWYTLNKMDWLVS